MKRSVDVMSEIQSIVELWDKNDLNSQDAVDMIKELVRGKIL